MNTFLTSLLPALFLLLAPHPCPGSDSPYGMEHRSALLLHLSPDGQSAMKLDAKAGQYVHGLVLDEDRAASARALAFRHGRHGPLFFTALSSKRLPYDDRTINVLVAEDRLGIETEELQRVITPLGSLWTRHGKGWKQWEKLWPGSIDEWTHYLHGPDNNAVARDTEIAPPNHLKWIQAPLFDRHHDTLGGFRAVVSSRGRVYSIEDTAPSENPYWGGAWVLRARDAFNGFTLWSKAIPEWSPIGRPHRTGPVQQPRRLVAIGDRVYVTLGHTAPVSELDATSGEVLQVFEGTERTQEILVDRGVLYLVQGDPTTTSDMNYYLSRAQRFGFDPETDPSYVKQPKSRLVAIRIEDRKQLWRRDDRMEGYWAMSLGVDREQVAYLDAGHLYLLDALTGEQVWQSERHSSVAAPGSPVTVVLEASHIFVADQPRLNAYDRRTGKALWDAKSQIQHAVNGPNLFYNRGSVWMNHLGGLDPSSGELKEAMSIPGKFQFHMAHGRCYRAKASSNFIISARNSTEFLPFGSTDSVAYDWLRGTCQYGMLPCNGLVYATPTNCECAMSGRLKGFYAMAKSAPPRPVRQDQPGRLLKGPAFGAVKGPDGTDLESNWPTFRSDMGRSNSVKAGLKERLKPRWKIALGDRLTQPVSSGGVLAVVDQAAQVLHLLDAASGATRWMHPCAGAVDSPPTLYGEMVLFGDRLGDVHALRQQDGERVWSFRAAPEERYIGAWGRVESTWPVHGSVLVTGGKLIVAAGRTSFLDGGIHTWALNPLTGAVLGHDRIEGPYHENGRVLGHPENEKDVQGCLADILSSDDRFVYMRHQVLDTNGTRSEHRGHPHLISSGGFLDHSRNHRSGWTVDTKIGYYLRSPGPDGELMVKDGDHIHAFKGCATGRQTRFDPLAKGFTLARYTMEKRPEQESHLIGTVVTRPNKATKPGKPGKKKKKKAVETRPFFNPRARGSTDIGYTFEQEQRNQLDFNVKSMLLSDGRLIMAGIANEKGPQGDPYAVLREGRGAAFRILDSAYETVQKQVLHSAVIPDGMAASEGRLYLSHANGDLSCWD
jgi:outer membrane protein assembly factor BamB